MSWTVNDMPDLAGRRVLVTGATDGIGLETALALAGRGAHVVLAGRSAEKGAAALAKVRAAHPTADIALEIADLSDLAQVRALAERVATQPLDILVNNAGVMAPPQRRETREGFELQFGVNYLAHFVLTGALLAALRAGAMKRVVALSSLAHLAGRIHFDDLAFERRYSPFEAYGQSKLAMLMFALELQRRSQRHGWGLVSNAAHPGFSRTNLIGAMRDDGGRPRLGQRIGAAIGPLLSQDAVAGAAPTLAAATAPDTQGAAYWGPRGPFEIQGPAGKAKISGRAADPLVAARLWDVSQALTGQPFGDGA